MWEESCESIRVRHRQVSEVRGDGADSDEEFIVIGSEESPLLPKSSTAIAHDSSSSAPPSAEGGPHLSPVQSRGARRESLLLDQPSQPMKLVLSSWGVAFTSSDSSPGPSPKTGLHASEPNVFALLSAENPYFARRAGQIAEKLGKCASNQRRAFEMKWDRPDLKILYRFPSVSDYGSMVKDLKDGKLRDVKVKGQAYRAVSLEPVRVIDSTLKCFLQIMFPLAINDEIKSSLLPLLNPVDVTKRFIFIPSLQHHQQLAAIEATDSAHDQPTPPILITLITSQPETSTARKITEAIKNSNEWLSYDFRCDPNPFKNQEVYHHKNHRSILPLFSLTAGSAGWGMENGIRVTLLCRENFEKMVEFYSLVLNSTHPPRSKDHVIFSLMDCPTSVVELVLQDCDAVGVSPCLPSSIKLNFIVEKMTTLAVKLSREFPSCEMREGESRGTWCTTDPLGNELLLHEREWMEVC